MKKIALMIAMIAVANHPMLRRYLGMTNLPMIFVLLATSISSNIIGVLASPLTIAE